MGSVARIMAIGGLGLFGVLPSLVPTAGQTLCVGDCNDNGSVTVDEILAMVGAALSASAAMGRESVERVRSRQASACLAGDPNNSGNITVDEILTAVNNMLDGCPAGPTATPMTSATPAATPTPGALGIRHFVIDPARSPFEAVLAPGFVIPLARFRGQTNGEVEDAFLDLRAGQPDDNGFAIVDLVAASEYIFADSSGLAQLVLCLKPQVPVTAAGIVACDGGLDLSIGTSVDHNLGRIGADGLTLEQCEDMGGEVEGPNQTCAAGLMGEPCLADADCDTAIDAGDGRCGLTAAACSAGIAGNCRNNAECDTEPGTFDGICGTQAAHPGLCNGPVATAQLGGDSGPGAVIIAPFEQGEIVLNGLPVELSIETAVPCGDEGVGDSSPFALTTATARTTIAHFNATDAVVDFERQGENFSCSNWEVEGGPGLFVLSFPALHQNDGNDVILSFTFSGPVATTAR